MSWFTDPFAENIFRKKYSSDLDVDDYYKQLAELVAKASSLQLYPHFFHILYNKKFSPGGRILAFGGRPSAKLSLMNCTTHKIMSDDLESISTAAYRIMRAGSRGQGIGVDLSYLRPRGSPVNNAAAESTGSISFMELLNNVGGTIGQLSRRSALLFSLSVDHPDLYRVGIPDGAMTCPKCHGGGCKNCVNGVIPYDFLHVKRFPGKVENANISVRITDSFMRAVQDNLPWYLTYKGKSSDKEFNFEREVPAVELFRALARSAWASAEPGILYWDTSHRMSNSDLFGDRWTIRGVNACSEEILDQDGVCNLGSINLAAFVVDPFTPNATINYLDLEKTTRLAIIFLDAVITMEIENGNYISSAQLQSLQFIRRLGLGVMGLADMLAMLGLPYANDERTITTIRKVMQVIRDTAYNTSVHLAQKEGKADVWNTVDDYAGIVNGGFFQTLPDPIKEKIVEHGTRNITLLSVAPTGTISNLLGVSSGIEPIFSHEYTRLTRINGKDELVQYVHPGVKLARRMGLPDSVYPTAHEIPIADHLAIQAVVQEYVDASISKTLNFPNTATVDDVERAYMDGYKLGLKGMSVYVDGSRDIQILYQKDGNTDLGKDVCDNCGSEMIHESGCTTCPACGLSVCSI